MKTILKQAMLAVAAIFLAATNTEAAVFTNLYNFTGGNDGEWPQTGLLLSGNVLYGTTQFGGSYTNGNVFAVNINGTGFTNLYSFSSTSWPNTNTDGAEPMAEWTKRCPMQNKPRWWQLCGARDSGKSKQTLPVTCGVRSASA